MKALNVTPAAQVLIDEWKEAKANEKGWNDIRKGKEEGLLGIYGEDLEEVLVDLSESTSLTTTVEIGDLKVTVGSTLVMSEVGAVEFLQTYPSMNGIMFKPVLKPVGKTIMTTMNGPEGDMAEMLDEVVTFKAKTPSFSLK